jgi:polyferredoxin
MSATSAVIVGFLLIGSCLVPNLWCRYLCPYGALMGLVALASPLRIRRVPDACIDCGKCAHACPSRLPVDRLIQVRSAECLGCMECVAACPAEGALFLAAPPSRRALRPMALAGAIAAVFLCAVGLAMVTGHWESAIPERVYRQLIPMVSSLSHP